MIFADIEAAVTVLEHTASLTNRLFRAWTGPSIDLVELRQRARRAIDSIQADLSDLTSEEQAELDAAVPRAG